MVIACGHWGLIPAKELEEARYRFLIALVERQWTAERGARRGCRSASLWIPVSRTWGQLSSSWVLSKSATCQSQSPQQKEAGDNYQILRASSREGQVRDSAGLT